MGDRGKDGHLSHAKPVSTDGVVPYRSSYLDGAESELIVSSGHWSNQHPAAIAEVRRIVLKHLFGREVNDDRLPLVFGLENSITIPALFALQKWPLHETP